MSAWPGNYRDICVSLAWESWQARAQVAPSVSVDEGLLEQLYAALPFVEDHEDNTCYKPGVVQKRVAAIKAAIQRAEASKSQPAPVAENVQFQSNVCEWRKSGIADTYTSTCGRTLCSRQFGRLCQYCGMPVRYKIEGRP
jgi:hypothetical protein